MQSTCYNVLLNYDPKNQEIHQKVVACLSRLDPEAPKRFEKTTPTGRLIVKRNADLATARRLKRILRDTGALCCVQRTADRLIRCGIVFIIALVLQVGLLSLGKMLWFLYISTPMGQYFLEKLPEKAEMLQPIVSADPLILGWDTSLTAMAILCMLSSCLHLARTVLP